MLLLLLLLTALLLGDVVIDRDPDDDIPLRGFHHLDDLTLLGRLFECEKHALLRQQVAAHDGHLELKLDATLRPGLDDPGRKRASREPAVCENGLAADHDREGRALLDDAGHGVASSGDNRYLLGSRKPRAVHCPTTFRRTQHRDEFLHRVHVPHHRVSTRPRPIAVLKHPAVRGHREGARPRVLRVRVADAEDSRQDGEAHSNDDLPPHGEASFS